MNRTFTSRIVSSIAALLGLVTTATAQDISTDIVGYANIWHSVQAAPSGGGEVRASAVSNGLPIWRSVFDFNQTVPVGQMIDTYTIMYYIYARPAADYTFAGWYEDTNGNGVLDLDTDQLMSVDSESVMMDVLPDGYAVYATQAEAKNGTKPSAPQATLFAYFTHGATVGISYYQDNALEHANCGSVFCDKPINEPGDVITVRALPNDGYQFEYWQSESSMGDVISRENPYTFAVQGGERLFAYFKAIDAPSFDLPEEGGFRVANLNASWVMTDESRKAGAHILVLEAEDLTRTADGKVFLDMSKEDVLIDIAQRDNLPTIIYGKGRVDFAYKMTYGVARKITRDALVRWSGDRGTAVKGENLYIYAFREDLGAFIAIGNTDMMINPDAPTTFNVPASLAYFSMSAFDLVDDYGNIPVAIGLSPETYDQAIAGVEEVTVATGPFASLPVYDMTGRRLKAQPQRGLYIVGGKKYFAK